MKKQILILLMLCSAFTKAQVTVDWFNYPGGVAVATDAANNVYTANWDYNPAGDITVTKRNSAGVILWDTSYDNTDNTRHEVATWVETDNAGNVIVSGTIRSGYSNPVNAASVLMKFNSMGTMLWRVVYETSFDGSSTRKCLIDANNNIYVLGIGTGPNGQVTKVKKFNSAGTSLWNYFDTGGGAPVNFKFTPDNKIVLVKRGITGNINSFSKIDSNGNLIWNTAGISSVSIGDAAGDAFGNTYLINAFGVGSQIKKLNSNAGVLWFQNNNMAANKVEVGSDNNPVISGYPGATYGCAFMKYDSNGNMLWQNLDADGPNLSLLAHAQLKLDGANAAYLAGSTMSQMGLCKVNSDGTSAWVATTSSGYPVCFDFGTDNSVYVTGGTTARYTQSTPCNTPVGLFTINLSPVQAKFNWTKVPGAVQYEIWHKKVSASVWKKRFVNGSAKAVVINNLTCNTPYEWKIRTLCDTVGVDVASAFSPVQNFTSASCRMNSADISTKEILFNVYPTIVDDFFTVETNTNSEIMNAQIVIADLTGRTVYKESINIEGTFTKQINVSNLPSGLYFIKLIADNETYTSKIVIE